MNEISIAALDGHALSATLYKGSASGPAVLISSGTCIPRQFYRHFASWLIERGAGTVVTYDYRGIGDSWPDAPKGEERKFTYLMSDWAKLDFPAMIDWLKENYPQSALYTIGHSFGGHAFGLSDRNVKVDKSVLITSMSGYWRKMVFPDNYKVGFLLNILGPLTGRFYGYIPGRFGLGEDMSRDAFLQWARWCSFENYFFDDPSVGEVENFSKYTGPLLAIGVDDDPWATPELIDNLVNNFNAANLERRQVSPPQYSGNSGNTNTMKVGHFGYFKPHHRDTFWHDLGNWLFDKQQGQH